MSLRQKQNVEQKRNVNRNAWSKSEEKLGFMQNVIYKYRHKKTQ